MIWIMRGMPCDRDPDEGKRKEEIEMYSQPKQQGRVD